ncbi:hypothetical protein [Sodalis sp. dw_96]|uniref:hypothetical protein n=1 Tax=Sodalis sp. dw_96 TaxID=2719794 RepID=UPI001BD64925|nr:hypothetical protein [Sodalis sp. dw_96]
MFNAVQESSGNFIHSPYDFSIKNPLSERQPAGRAPLLRELKEQAKKNVAESIEYLFTLACQASPEAAVAENFLFDLYSGKEPGDTLVKEQLGKDSLRLFTLVQQRNQHTRRESTDIWELPTKLLIMAAFEADSGSAQQAALFDKMLDSSAFLTYISEVNENTPESALATNRYISSVEINAFSSALQVDDNLRFYPAADIANDEVTNGNPQRILLSLDSPAVDSPYISFGGTGGISGGIPASEPAARFIPLLFRDHWILFGWFINADNQKDAIVLDSLRYLNPNEKNFLVNLAHHCGVRQERAVTFIEEDLQENAPNACGLFVAKAMESLCKDSQKSLCRDSHRRVGIVYPTETLRNFAEQFALNDIQEQRLFNHHGRAELYAVTAQSVKEQEPYLR